ncbi:MAG: hypothetical protein K5799_11395 [Erythrobacter sp.]|nr:hypothetical protein [Erythrobacter sp.]
MEGGNMTQAMMTSRAVREACGNVSDMTLHRWSRDDRAGFPQPKYVNRRRYWRADEIRQWWESRSTEAPPAPNRETADA